MCLDEVLPLLRSDIAVWILQRHIVLAISRLELAAEALGIMKDAIMKEIEDSVLDELALEVQAQKEAEEAASNEEESVSFIQTSLFSVIDPVKRFAFIFCRYFKWRTCICQSRHHSQ
ncbi:unnamed protein product [Trichobilharzia regenti]|nr:unnamed protein product [Trichobilharzia regenti]